MGQSLETKNIKINLMFTCLAFERANLKQSLVCTNILQINTIKIIINHDVNDLSKSA